MSDSTKYEESINALAEPVFAALASESVRDYVDWEQLTNRQLPPGLSLSQTWELLGRVRQFGGTTFPIPTTTGAEFWYGLTREGQKCLAYIRRYCRPDSALHEMLQNRDGHRFLVRSRIQEAIATLQLDGILVDNQRASQMLRQGRSPQNAGDRLVLNSYEMLRELESLAGEPFSPELVKSLYERVTHGVDLAALKRGPRRTNLAGTRDVAEMRAEAEDRQIVQTVCDYANGVSGDPMEPAAIKGYMILSAMAYWHPLPDLNDTVARHMLRLFSVKRDYPVLGYLPTSLMMLKWMDGSLDRSLTRFAKLERRPVVPDTIDGTEDILTHLQLTTAALAELLGYIEETREEEAVLQEALESATDLNYRQRSILSAALAHPSMEFRIRQHQMSYRVVYQTARTDLLELAERGYLRCETRGKAFVFVPVEDLQVLVRGEEQAAG